MQRRVRVENPELLRQFTEHGQSVVLLAAHFCNWEWLLLTAGTQVGIPIDAVYKPQRVAGFDRFLREGRSRFGGNPIPANNFLVDVMKRKGQVRAYALVADQTPLKHEEKHWSRFLNQDTAFFVGADKIARILNAPVLFVVDAARAPWLLFGATRAAGRAALRPRPGPWKRRQIIESYARALEDEIRASPADWLWIHRKWKYAKPLYA